VLPSDCSSNDSRIHLSLAVYNSVQAVICISGTCLSAIPRKCSEKFHVIAFNVRPSILLPTLNALAATNVSMPGNLDCACCSSSTIFALARPAVSSQTHRGFRHLKAYDVYGRIQCRQKRKFPNLREIIPMSTPNVRFSRLSGQSGCAQRLSTNVLFGTKRTSQCAQPTSAFGLKRT